MPPGQGELLPCVRVTKFGDSALVSPGIGITTQYLRDFVQGTALPHGILEEVQSLAANYLFFHWQLALP